MKVRAFGMAGMAGGAMASAFAVVPVNHGLLTVACGDASVPGAPSFDAKSSARKSFGYTPGGPVALFVGDFGLKEAERAWRGRMH